MATLTGPGKIYITSMNFSKWHRVLSPSLGTSSSSSKEHEAPE
jgi:hypothetical protein